jgi:hypothetical protein
VGLVAKICDAESICGIAVFWAHVVRANGRLIANTVKTLQSNIRWFAFLIWLISFTK